MRGPNEPVVIHRKVIQIVEQYVPWTSDHSDEWTLTALCNDGTIWTVRDHHTNDWEEILPPPGCEDSSGEQQ